MNATLLYTKLSLEVLNFNSECNDDYLNNFMKNDRGFYKLRSLLLCRACRELCIEPYCSSFCNHLVCKQCLEEKQSRNPGCKWCRNEEELHEDPQSKIIIGLYKQLCAILKDLITERNDTDMPGTSSSVRDKLLKFLNEGCSLPDIVVPQVPELEESKPIQTIPVSKKRKGRKPYSKVKEVNSCQPCCCTCNKSRADENIKHEISKVSDISNDPVKVTAAQSSEEHKNESQNSPEYASDNVSSTVPDSLPTEHTKSPNSVNHNNKDGYQSKKDLNRIKQNKVKEILEKHRKIARKSKYETIIHSKAICKSTDKILLSNGEDSYGNLNLIPTTFAHNESSGGVYKRKKQSKEKNRNRMEGKSGEIQLNQSPPKIQPLKLTVQKINNQNNDVSYKIQCSSATDSESNNNLLDVNEDTQSNNEGNEDAGRKLKRKATFVTNYAVFSSDSDFEPEQTRTKKRYKKPAAPKETRETCGCGNGNHVKFFTDICKRLRCPCFSQGRACVNCKCRFCSNPFSLEDEVLYSDNSESLQGQSESYWINNELGEVDVEAM